MHVPMSKTDHYFILQKSHHLKKKPSFYFLRFVAHILCLTDFQFSFPLNSLQLSGKVLREFPVFQSGTHRNALLMNRSPWQHSRRTEDWLPSAAYRALTMSEQPSLLYCRTFSFRKLQTVRGIFQMKNIN